MKPLLMFAVALLASGCISEKASSTIINVKCEGLVHYTGLIGTTMQFTESEFIKDLRYSFDLERKEVIIDTVVRAPYCSGARHCDVNFGSRLITAVRGEARGGRVWTAALSFDRETKVLQLTRSDEGEHRQSSLVCTELN